MQHFVKKFKSSRRSLTEKTGQDKCPNRQVYRILARSIKKTVLLVKLCYNEIM